MKSEKKKILSGKECEVMNYLPYFKEPPIDVIKRYKTIKRYALISPPQNETFTRRREKETLQKTRCETSPERFKHRKTPE